MIFDKTGTLTVGRPNVVATNVFNNEGINIEWKEFMAIAGTAEMQSEHPLGIALKDRAIEVSTFLTSHFSSMFHIMCKVKSIFKPLHLEMVFVSFREFSLQKHFFLIAP